MIVLGFEQKFLSVIRVSLILPVISKSSITGYFFDRVGPIFDVFFYISAYAHLFEKHLDLSIHSVL